MAHNDSTRPHRDYAADRRARAVARLARAEVDATRERAASDALRRRSRAPAPATAMATGAARLAFERAPRLADGPYARGVQLVLGLPHVRPDADWIPRGKGRSSTFRSLADHILARYPTPPVLWTVFLDPRTEPLARVAARVAAGESLFDAVRDGTLCVPLTRRMCHDVLTDRHGGSFLEAIRRVQVVAAGGDARLLQSWLRTPTAQTLATRDEETFATTVLVWLAKNPVEPSQLGPLMDYIAHRRREDASFAMSGRSVAALVRGMLDWHRDLAQAKVVHGVAFEPSGFRPATFDLSERTRDGEHKQQIWRVEEVLTGKALAAEGRRMGHCVYSYAWAIERRQTSIWTMTLEDGQGITGHWAMLTIEVRNESRAVVQARGRYNRSATSAEHRVLVRWATMNGLSINVGIGAR